MKTENKVIYDHALKYMAETNQPCYGPGYTYHPDFVAWLCKGLDQKDDLAAKTAIEFAEWTSNNMWDHYLGDGWIQPSDPLAEPLSTAELYTLWQQSLPPESDQVNT